MLGMSILAAIKNLRQQQAPVAAARASLRHATANRVSRRPVTASTGPVVSLTSYGKRLERAHLTIESIAQGTVLPSRLILWVDERADLPSGIRRLRRRGLEVRETHGEWGPHKKYYPYCISGDLDPAQRLVTADDDVCYPQGWLAGLVSAAEANPGAVWAYRTKQITFNADGTLAAYATWPFSSTRGPSHRHIATGVSGVSYPPELLPRLRDQGEVFMRHAARTDDIWLHWNALRAGLPVGQVNPAPGLFPDLLGTQSSALWASNMTGGRNDPVFADLYSPQDLAEIRDGLNFTGLSPQQR